MSTSSATKNENKTDIIVLFLRIIIGLFLIYHGIEVFDLKKMQEYAGWMPDPGILSPNSIAYLGKSAELVTGLMLITGLGTRLASIVVIIIFLFISFKLGDGRIFMQEQHPFMFVLFGVLFLAEGGRKWSLDYYIKNLRRDRRP